MLLASNELDVCRVTGIMQFLEQRARQDVPGFGKTAGRSPRAARAAAESCEPISPA